MINVRYKTTTLSGGGKPYTPPVTGPYIQYISSSPLNAEWIAANCKSNSWSASSGQGLMVLKDGITEISQASSPFTNNSGLTVIDLSHSGLETIGSGAFHRSTNIEAIVFPSTMEHLLTGAFDNKRNLVSIVVPDDNEYFNDYGCNIVVDSLGQIVIGCSTSSIPSQVESIGPRAFEGATMESFSIPGNVRVIASDAFKDCSDMETLTINSGINYIMEGAFSGNSSLERVTCFSEVPPTLADGNFSEVLDDVLYVPGTALQAYRTDPAWSAAFSQILPIGEEQFEVSVEAIPLDGGYFILL